MAQTTDKARRWTVRPEYRLTEEERQRIRRSLDWSHASEEERAAMQEEQRQGLAVEPLSTKDAAELYRRKLGQYEESGRGAYRPALFEQHARTWEVDRPSKGQAVLAVLGWLLSGLMLAGILGAAPGLFTCLCEMICGL